MFCSKCGAELADDAVFCNKCGARVSEESSKGEANPSTSVVNDEPASIKKRNTEDKTTDFIASKLSGKKVETVRISKEDMLKLLDKHFISQASTDKEYKKIQKAVNGALMGVSKLESKDGNYQLSVSVAFQLGGKISILHPGDSNWIRVLEVSTGKVYQYSAFTWGKFKKAVKKEIRDAKSNRS